MLTWFCERSGDGLSWSPPARPLQVDTMRELFVEDVLLQSTFPELLPSGANKQGNGGPLDPLVSEEDAEEDARSTDEEGRLLTKRCIERQWQNTCFRVKRLPCDHESGGQS